MGWDVQSGEGWKDGSVCVCGGGGGEERERLVESGKMNLLSLKQTPLNVNTPLVFIIQLRFRQPGLCVSHHFAGPLATILIKY